MTFFVNNQSIYNNRTLGAIINDSELKYRIKEYLIIKTEYANNIPLNDNIVFRDVFCQLYDINMRRKTLMLFNCQEGFFKVFQQVKNNNNFQNYKYISFLLQQNNIKTVGRNDKEWVFASKMLHTVDGNKPIIDKNIENIFGSANIRVSRRNYGKFENAFNRYRNTDPEAQVIINLFRNTLHYTQNQINDVKVLDFILWMAGKK